MRSSVDKVALKYKWILTRGHGGYVTVEKKSKTQLIERFSFWGEDGASYAERLVKTLNEYDEEILRLRGRRHE